MRSRTNSLVQVVTSIENCKTLKRTRTSRWLHANHQSSCFHLHILSSGVIVKRNINTEVRLRRRLGLGVDEHALWADVPRDTLSPSKDFLIHPLEINERLDTITDQLSPLSHQTGLSPARSRQGPCFLALRCRHEQIRFRWARGGYSSTPVESKKRNCSPAGQFQAWSTPAPSVRNS